MKSTSTFASCRGSPLVSRNSGRLIGYLWVAIFSGVGSMLSLESVARASAKIFLPSAQEEESWEMAPRVEATLLRVSSFPPTSGKLTRGAFFGSPYSQCAKTSQVPRPGSLL